MNVLGMNSTFPQNWFNNVNPILQNQLTGLTGNRGDLTPAASSIFAGIAFLNSLLNSTRNNNNQNQNIYGNPFQQQPQYFQRPLNEINGDQGIYGTDTAVEKGANAGNTIFNLIRSGRAKEVEYSNYQYMNKDNDGKLDIDSGLAFHKNVMKVYDKNKDGEVTKNEVAKPVFDVTDINGDGKLSAGEQLARSMVVDTNKDGKVSFEEKRAFQAKVVDSSNKDELFSQIKQTYTENSIGEKESNFEMPEQKWSNCPPTYANPYRNQQNNYLQSLFLQLLDFMRKIKI